MRRLLHWFGEKRRAYNDLCHALASMKRYITEAVDHEAALADAQLRTCDAYMGKSKPRDCYELDNEQRTAPPFVADSYKMEFGEGSPLDSLSEEMPDDPRERQTWHNAQHYKVVKDGKP